MGLIATLCTTPADCTTLGKKHPTSQGLVAAFQTGVIAATNAVTAGGEAAYEAAETVEPGVGGPVVKIYSYHNRTRNILNYDRKRNIMPAGCTLQFADRQWLQSNGFSLTQLTLADDTTESVSAADSSEAGDGTPQPAASAAPAAASPVASAG